MKPGSRVGAVSHSNNNKVYLFGYGVYEGDFPFDDDATGDIVEMSREVDPNLGNPRIRLDSGEVIWGAECWWGAEDQVKDSCIGCEVINVSISEQRAEYKAEQESRARARE